MFHQYERATSYDISKTADPTEVGCGKKSILRSCVQQVSVVGQILPGAQDYIWSQRRMERLGLAATIAV